MRPRRDSKASSSESSSACPWKWKLSKTRLQQVPPKIVKAACPRCAHYCRPIYYQIKVLVRDGCDPVSGMSLWRWRERRIAVAYVVKTWKYSQTTCSCSQPFPSEGRHMEIKPCEKALDRQDAKRVANLKASLRSKGRRQFTPLATFTENITSTADATKTLIQNRTSP